MATREEKNLTEQIRAQAQKLKLEAPPTDGLDARQLSSLLDELRALEGPQTAGKAPEESGKADLADAPSGDGSKGTPGPQTQSAPVNPETGISPVEASGSVRTEGSLVPSSTPDEVAPVPDAAGNVLQQPKPRPSSTGYRVADGKSIASGRNELLSEGAEIGERDVAGGTERLEELVEGGYVVKTEKTSADNAQSKS